MFIKRKYPLLIQKISAIYHKTYTLFIHKKSSIYKKNIRYFILGARLPGVRDRSAYEGGIPAGTGLHQQGDRGQDHPLDQHETG